jgi:hypothetical protein
MPSAPKGRFGRLVYGGVKLAGGVAAATLFCVGAGYGAGRAVPFAVASYFVRDGEQTLREARPKRGNPEGAEVKRWVVMLPMTNHFLQIALIKHPADDAVELPGEER